MGPQLQSWSNIQQLQEKVQSSTNNCASSKSWPASHQHDITDFDLTSRGNDCHKQRQCLLEEHCLESQQVRQLKQKAGCWRVGSGGVALLVGVWQWTKDLPSCLFSSRTLAAAGAFPLFLPCSNSKKYKSKVQRHFELLRALV